jgi:hypothetical protein
MAKRASSVDWDEIADSLASLSSNSFSKKTAKQCRERWHNSLDPSINQSPWTSKETITFFQLFERYGAKWAKIGLGLPGRTDNTIKNFFYYRLRKIVRRIKKSAITEDMKDPAQEIDHNLFLMNYLLNSYSKGKAIPQAIKGKYISNIIFSSNISYDVISKYLKEYKRVTRGMAQGLSTDDSFSKHSSVSNAVSSSPKASIAKEEQNETEVMTESDYLFITQVSAIDQNGGVFITLPQPNTVDLNNCLTKDQFQPTFQFTSYSPLKL